jgi:NADH-quinone oxidoreductase subunit L
MWIAIAGAFVTAFYMTRVVALTFHGDYKGHGHPHESPRVMTVPLVLLAIPSAIAGLFSIPGVTLPGIGNFSAWLATREVVMGDHHAEGIDFFLAGSGVFAAMAGIALGWMIFGKDRDTQEARDTFEVPVLYPLLRNKYYMDDLANGVVGATMGPIARFVNWTNTYIIDAVVNSVALLTKGLGAFVYGILDQRGVDGVVHGLSAATDGAGSALRKMQTGRVQQYAASFVGGVLALIIVFMFVT